MSQQAEKMLIKVDEIGHETAKAIKVKKDGTECWVPLSQVSEIHRDSADPYIVVTAWIAKKNGWR